MNALPLSMIEQRPIRTRVRSRREGPQRLWTKPKTPLTERIRLMSAPNANGCWIWQAATATGGYGKVSVRGKLIGAHRASYEAFKGTIPTGLVIDHLCRVTSCVNPDHLEAVTESENVLRGTAPCALLSGAPNCRYGHPYDEGNIYRGKDGVRQCKTCRRNNSRRYNAKRKSA